MDSAAIRRLVTELLPELGCPKAEPNWETILLADGSYLGRRFEFDTVRAYWYVATNTIEFYSSTWELLKSVSVADHLKNGAA